jgi:hypothetical protein
MNLKSVQDYFKEQIAKGSYVVVRKDVTTFHEHKLWIDLLVDDRPFVIVITERGKVRQDGQIEENYLNIGEFNENQKQQIYDRYKEYF